MLMAVSEDLRHLRSIWHDHLISFDAKVNKQMVVRFAVDISDVGQERWRRMIQQQHYEARRNPSVCAELFWKWKGLEDRETH